MTEPNTHSVSRTQEILQMHDTQVPDYISKKRQHHELSGIIAHLNHELLRGSPDTRTRASAALQKLGYVVD